MATLFVVSPGLASDRTTFKDLQQALHTAMGDQESDWELVDHRKGYLSLGSAPQLARDIVARIDAIWRSNPVRYDRIVFVGYSAGAVLCRFAYLIAAGMYEERRGPGKDLVGYPRAPWFAHVKGFLLIAGVNRGWRPWLPMLPVLWLGEQIGVLGWFFGHDLVNGSTFVTNVRVDWMDLMSRLGPARPRVIQVRGTRDSVVADADSRDVLQFPEAEQIELENETHLSVMTQTATLAKVATSLAQDRTPNASQGVKPAAASQRVVFIVHGIRDSRDSWPEDLEAEIRSIDPSVIIFRPSYGYLSALRFMAPANRARQKRWLCDQYTNARADFPSANFHFVGHSNGTYTLGWAQADVYGIRFQRVVLMGSVLPRDFDWDRLRHAGQVVKVENHRSRWDWPVGLLCSGLRGLGMRDLGTGGFSGFNARAPHDVRWYPGGHGSPMREDRSLRQIARFVCERIPETWPDGERPPLPTKWFQFLSRLAPVLAWCIVATYIAAGVTAFLWFGWLGIAGLLVLTLALAAVADAL